jgi:hypothetical protein
VDRADKVLEVEKQASLFPNDSPALRASMREETSRFFTHVVFDGSHKASELFTANYTFVDAELAKHYGMPAPKAAFEKQTYPDGARSGLLGHAACSRRRRTRPVVAHPPRPLRAPQPALPGAPAAAAERRAACRIDPQRHDARALRAAHGDPFCASCHQYIDDRSASASSASTPWASSATPRTASPSTPGRHDRRRGLGKRGTSAPFSRPRELGKTLGSERGREACVAKQSTASRAV